MAKLSRDLSSGTLHPRENITGSGALVSQEELRRLRFGGIDGAFGQFGHGRS